MQGVAEFVHFAGKQPHIADCLSLADLFLLPSEMESFGLAALEAMACEVPVVASRVGGLPEVIDEGVTGYLLEMGDVDGMAEAAIQLLQDEDLHQEMSRRARAVAVERFSSQKIVPIYEAFYQEVLQKTVTSDQ